MAHPCHETLPRSHPKCVGRTLLSAAFEFDLICCAILRILWIVLASKTGTHINRNSKSKAADRSVRPTSTARSESFSQLRPAVCRARQGISGHPGPRLCKKLHHFSRLSGESIDGEQDKFGMGLAYCHGVVAVAGTRGFPAPRSWTLWVRRQIR